MFNMNNTINIDNSKVYALIRVSSDKQDFSSQLEGITNWCRSNNIELLEQNIISEFNVSGFKTKIENREGIQQIYKLVENKSISMLVIFNLDRIGRRTELISFFDYLTDNNVLIISTTEGILNDKKNNSAFDLISYIKFWTANFESKKISERTVSGKMAIAKANNRGFNGGKILLGYKVNAETKQLEVDEQMRDIIVNMYKKYIEGGSKEAIKYLEKYGIKKNNATLLTLIKNTTFKGIQQRTKWWYEQGGSNRDKIEERIEDYEELMNCYNPRLQIVSEELWQQANDKIQANRTNLKGKSKHGGNRTNFKYEGLCYSEAKEGENKLTLQKDYRGKEVKYILQDRKAKAEKLNRQKNWSAKKLEEIIDSKLDYILSYELNKENLEKYYNSRNNSNAEELELRLRNKEAELENKNKQLKNSKKKLELLLSNEDMSMDLIEIVSNTIKNIGAEANRLEKEIFELKKELEEQSNNRNNDKSKFKTLLQVKDLYYKATEEQKKQLIQVLVKKVVVSTDYDYNIKVYLNY